MKANGMMMSAALAALLCFSGCSNLFEKFVEDDGTAETGDDTLTISAAAVATAETYTAATTDSTTTPTPTPDPPANANPGDYYNSPDDNESLNTVITSGLVVIKSLKPTRNQITYNASVTTYEVGYQNATAYGDDEYESDGTTRKNGDSAQTFTDAQKAGRAAGTSVYLTSYDDPVTVKCFANSKNATVSYAAVQTRTTNVALNPSNYTTIASDTEHLIDLAEGSQSAVTFTSIENGVTLAALPYGTTKVTVVVTADDSEYTTTYIILLNKKHTLTTIMIPDGTTTKTTLNTGLVVLKKSITTSGTVIGGTTLSAAVGSYNCNQIVCNTAVKDYLVGSETGVTTANGATTGDYSTGTATMLTAADMPLVLKCIPADKHATVTWKAVQVEKPLYGSSDTYINVTTTTFTDSDTPTTSTTTVQYKSSDAGFAAAKIIAEQSNNTVTESFSSNRIKTITVYNERIIKIETAMTPLVEGDANYQKDITSTVIYDGDSSNVNDRVKYAELPYGVTVVTMTVTSDDSAFTTVYSYSLTKTSVASESTGGIQDDDTSKLTGLSIVTQNTSSPDGTTPAASDTSNTGLVFSMDKTFYRITVGEDTDQITFAPSTTPNTTVGITGARTKYGSETVNDYTVLLSGGTSVITFTVTEAGQQPRTYTIFVSKPEDGVTTLSNLVWASRTSAGAYNAGSSYANGLTDIPLKTAASGGETLDTAKEYDVTVSADNRIDIENMAFTAVPTHTYTRLAYSTDGTTWTSDYTKAVESALVVSANTVLAQGGGLSATPYGNVYQKSFDLNNTGTSPVTTLYIRATTKAYMHDGESSKRSDVRYHKIVLTKAGNSSTKLTALAAYAGYEDDTSKVTTLNKINTDTTTYDAEHIAYDAAPDTSIGISELTTYADSVTFYFRTMDKDVAPATILYSATHPGNVSGSDPASTTFTNYQLSAASTHITTTTSVPWNSSNTLVYYTFTIGSKDKGTDSKLDLPNGTTTIKLYINGAATPYTITVTKPDLATTTCSVGCTGGTEQQTSNNEVWFKVGSTVTDAVLNLTTSQQAETITVPSAATWVENANKESYSGGTVQYLLTPSKTTLTSWTLQIGETSPSGKLSSPANDKLPIGTTKITFQVTNTKASGPVTWTVYVVRPGETEARLTSLTVSGKGKKISSYDWSSAGTKSTTNSVFFGMVSSDQYSFDSYTVSSAPTGDYTYAEVPVNTTASAVTVKTTVYRTSSVVTASTTDDSWCKLDNSGSVQWTADTPDLFESTTSSSSNQSGDKTITLTASDKSVLVVTKVTASGVVHVYYVLIRVQLNQDNTLSALKAVQYSSGTTSGDYDFNIMGASFNPATTTYTKYSDFNRVGNIVVTPTLNSSLATITGTTAVHGSTDLSSYMSSNVFSLPYSIYKDYDAGSNIVVTYTVQAQDPEVSANSYTLTITLPTFTKVSTIDAGNASGYYQGSNTTYKHAMAYKFGSLIGDTASSLKNYFGGLDIMGGEASGGTVAEGSWHVSSFAQSGWQYVINVGGTDYWVKLGTNGVSSEFYTLSSDHQPSKVDNPGVTLTITPTIEYDGTSEDATPYLVIKHVLENTSGKSVKLGAVIDTLVGTVSQATTADNDNVTITPTNNGFSMTKDNYKFSVVLKNAQGVDDVSKFWYGQYDASEFTYLKAFENTGAGAFTNNSHDSSASYSWDLGNSASYTRTIRISMMPTN